MPLPIADPHLERGYVPADLPHWTCTRLRLHAGEEVHLQFADAARQEEAWLQVLPAQRSGQGVTHLAHCAVKYGFKVGREPQRKADVARLLRSAAAAIDARLADLAPGAPLAQAFGRRAQKLSYGPEALLALLAPDIVPGQPVAGGWLLRGVHPTWLTWQSARGHLALSLDFERAPGEHVALQVLPREPGVGAFVHAAHLSLRCPSHADDAPFLALRNLVGFLLEVRDHAGLDLDFPEQQAQPASAPVPAAQGLVNLALHADCGQACAFCSIREHLPPLDADEAEQRRATEILADGRRRGLEHLRVTGLDPLAFPGIAQLLALARDTGYASAAVYTPGVRLADPAFCAAVCEAMPPKPLFGLALHGACAATHDRIVGVPGAFAQVQRAIANLKGRDPDLAVHLSATAIEENLGELAGIVRWADARRIPCVLQMAYADSESGDAPFFRVAPRQTAVAGALLDLYRDERPDPLKVEGLAPCVLLRALAAAGIGIRGRMALDRPAALPGHDGDATGDTAQVRSTAAQPCPHAAACALLPACGGKLLGAYVHRFGVEEFAAVSLAELVAAV